MDDEASYCHSLCRQHGGWEWRQRIGGDGGWLLIVRNGDEEDEEDEVVGGGGGRYPGTSGLAST